jgi:uncharacterized membrane protein HdeD (DUF308 family)
VDLTNSVHLQHNAALMEIYMSRRDSPYLASGHRASPSLRWLAIAFLALGAAALLAPAAATVAITVLIAALMMFWGLCGVWLAFEMRHFPEWRFSAAAFSLLAACGALFLALPGAGEEVLTLLVVAGLLAEGVISIFMGMRLRSARQGERGLIASGAVSLVIGLIVLIDWPTSADLLLGIVLGINFLATGASLLVLQTVLDPKK